MNPPDDKVTADTRELWERAFDAYCNGTGDATSHERAAAVLAPVVRDCDHFLALANSQKARAEAAEANLAEAVRHVTELIESNRGLSAEVARMWQERDQLRAEVVRLERDAYLGDDDEKRHLRAEFEKLTIVAAQTADRNTDLRAEVERLQRLNLDAVRSIDSRGEEIADLRAQLAASPTQRLNDSTAHRLNDPTPDPKGMT